MKQFTEREINLHTAKVLLGEAMKRRAAGRSHAVLLQWAGDARRRAAAALPTRPGQTEMLFHEGQ